MGELSRLRLDRSRRRLLPSRDATEANGISPYRIVFPIWTRLQLSALQTYDLKRMPLKLINHRKRQFNGCASVIRANLGLTAIPSNTCPPQVLAAVSSPRSLQGLPYQAVGAGKRPRNDRSPYGLPYLKPLSLKVWIHRQ